MLEDFIKTRAFIFLITLVTASLLSPGIPLALTPQVAAGFDNTLGLNADGTVVIVGSDGNGRSEANSWTGIRQVAAAYDHVVGLKADGTVVAVGWNGDGQCDVGSWSGIQQVAAGSYHTVGLKADGTVVAVGNNVDGQCDVGSWTGIQQVAAGEWHSVGLKADGTVVAVGWNSDGDVDSWTGIQQVAAGAYHTVGLKADGTVVAVGWNGDGQLDVDSWSGIQQVAAGGDHTVGLKADGTVVAVGTNSWGQCNVDDLDLMSGSAENPVITSNGGGAIASVNVAENQTGVTDVDATDDNPADTLAYSISGGADDAKFSINSSSGVLTFFSVPDYENPTDIGANNVYDVQVTVTDNGAGNLTDVQDITVTVHPCDSGACPQLIVIKEGSGNGTVTSTNISGISCGSECFEFYNQSSQEVTLSAVSDGNSIFYGWSGGGCSDLNTCTLVMDADTTVTAYFVSALQREALLALYAATEGANWTAADGWQDLPGTECTWFGITCDSSFNIINIELKNNRLTGTIPPEIENLTSLQYLNLYINQLEGTIPTELWTLTNLIDLYLGSNQLTGSIPPEVGDLVNLQVLSLPRNQLGSKIPSELWTLTNLIGIDFDENQFIGAIPSAIGDLTNLQWFVLEDNQFTGAIPSEIGNLKSLQWLYLGGNQLSVPLPPELWTLTNLSELDLSFTQLRGSVPAEIGDLTKLQYLDLSDNQFIGSIPAEFTQLTELQALYIGNNCLTDFAAVSLVPEVNGVDSQRPVGDINTDAALDATDVIMMLQIMSGNSAENIDFCGDADANGKIGIEDALYTIQTISGLKP